MNHNLCETCKGEGKLYYSCCGDELESTDFEGGDCLCPTCQEHCSIDDFEECSDCNGLGYLVIDEQDEKAWEAQTAGDWKHDEEMDRSL